MTPISLHEFDLLRELVRSCGATSGGHAAPALSSGDIEAGRSGRCHGIASLGPRRIGLWAAACRCARASIYYCRVANLRCARPPLESARGLLAQRRHRNERSAVCCSCSCLAMFWKHHGCNTSDDAAARPAEAEKSARRVSGRRPGTSPTAGAPAGLQSLHRQPAVVDDRRPARGVLFELEPRLITAHGEACLSLPMHLLMYC